MKLKERVKIMMNNSDDAMDLFSDLGEEDRRELGLEVAQPAQHAKKAAKGTSAAKEAQEVEPDEYPIDRTVYYAGRRLAVPDRAWKKEDVRAWLEEQFPELRKENTEMVYDDKTGALIPVIKAHKKGAGAPAWYEKRDTITVHTKTPGVRPAVWLQLMPNGHLWEFRSTQAGLFVLPAGCPAEHLIWTGGYIPALPKPSVDLLRQIVLRFQAEPEKEHLAYIVRRQDRWDVVWPEQAGTPFGVVGQGFLETEEEWVYLQIHSHGRLPAYFSATDDADEVRTGLYAVVGRCDRTQPEYRFRLSVAGRFSPLHPKFVFDGDVASVVGR